MRGLLPALFLWATFGCGGTLPLWREVCSNGVDDDANGLVDCADTACRLEPACDGQDSGANDGSCQKCGLSCVVQADCLAQSFVLDEPLPQCGAGTCRAREEGVRLRFEVDTAPWNGVGVKLGSLNTRFVSKTAVDGRTVRCDTLKALAASKAAADASQLERSGQLNLVSFDVSAISAIPGDVLVQPFLPVNTGSDFIIWTEIWAGPPDSNTKMPTGNRLGFGCFEDGPEVAPVLLQHHWSSATPSMESRTIRVVLPPPQ